MAAHGMNEMASNSQKSLVLHTNYQVLFYVTNLIGYVRIVLLAAAWFYMNSEPEAFLALYVISVILDAFDGIAARKLNQTSAFGAWFDVVIDNFGRGFLWSHLFKWGYLVSAFEWLVFVCTHTHGPKWKNPDADAPPLLVKVVMADNFKTIVGTYAISGLHVLPIWLYGLQNLKIVHKTIDSRVIIGTITAVLATGRLTCVLVEGWFIWTHIKALLTNFTD